MINFNFKDVRFSKQLIRNPEGSIVLGFLNLVHAVTGLPIAGSAETLTMDFVMRGIAVKLTRNGTPVIQFPEHLRTKVYLDVNGQSVLDEKTGRKLRTADLDSEGKEQWDADYFTVSAPARAALVKYAFNLAPVAEALTEALALIAGAPAPATSDEAQTSFSG